MVPPMRAESYGQLSRFMLERCDGLAASSYCPRLPGVPVAEVFDEERAALMPLPSTAFDPVRWESRTADKYGLVDIDSNRYLAGPDSAVYGQINVYGVTTKSERHKRSYWTRTADGNGIGGRKAPVPYGS